jgi:hypothetical protein
MMARLSPIQKALLLYNNVYQLMTLFMLEAKESHYFINDHLEPHFEPLNNDFDFIKDYFMTKIYMSYQQGDDLSLLLI